MRRAKTSHAAFTLVELLIGVTVSAIIMAGVSVFMGSGIESAFKIRKGIEDNRASGDFDAALGKFVAFGGELLYSGSFSAPFGSGIVLKNANRPIPLGILAVETITGVCDAYSGTSDDPGIATKLSIIETYAPNGIENAAGLTVDHTGHVVRNASDAVVLGTGNGGNSGGNGTAGTSTELFYPSAVLGMGGGKYLVADSGNDRVLLLSWAVASTLVGPNSGIRHPHAMATDGTDIRIAESGRVFGILGNPPSNGSVLSGSFDSTAAFAFDSVKITLGGGRVPPSVFSNYSFDFTAPAGTAFVVWSTATVSFSWATKSYAVGDRATVWVTGIPASAVASASYQATVQYFLSGTEKYRRTIPYFTAGDGNPLTMGDNAYEVTDTGATYPVKASFGGGGFVSEDLTAFGNLPNVAAAATRIDSPRFVEAFETASDGKTLTVRFIEFIRYDCLSGNHVKRERIFKIPLR